MGFFNLRVTVIVHASTANISTTTRPFFVCPSVLAICTRDWWTTRSNPASVALIGRQGIVKTLKRGTEAPLNPGFGLLIR